ncbi:MAG: DUF192 domain-containing protein [Elusimicrobiota bacterium]|jgi:uncharacterized membrane protein (UPF0127 family)|nr:DUF192 domain-containing protein [Elusimicrobiota bacterium]
MVKNKMADGNGWQTTKTKTMTITATDFSQVAQVLETQRTQNDKDKNQKQKKAENLYERVSFIFIVFSRCRFHFCRLSVMFCFDIKASMKYKSNMKTLYEYQREQKIAVIEAKTFWQKFSGFMLKQKADYGLLFRNTAYIHTFFMFFDLDVIFLDKNDNILKIQYKIKPWRLVLPPKNTVSILEVPSLSR